MRHKQLRAGWGLLAAVGLLLAACGQAMPLPVVSTGTIEAQATTVTALATAAPTVVSAALTSTVPTLAAGWKTYVDEAAGYSLGYPENVHFKAGYNKKGVYTARLQFRLPGVAGYQGMVLRVEPNPDGRGVEELLARVYRHAVAGETPADLTAALQDITVNGLAGVQMGEGGDFAIAVPYGDRVYLVAPVHDEVMTALDPQALALFYQVLATLKVQP